MLKPVIVVINFKRIFGNNFTEYPTISVKAGVGRDSQLIAQVDSGLRRNVQSAQQVDLGFDDLDPRWRCAEIHLPPVPSPNKTRLNCCNYMKENVSDSNTQPPKPVMPLCFVELSESSLENSPQG